VKSLRTHLVVLVLAAVLPLLVLAVAVMGVQLAEKREIIDGSMKAVAGALSLAVDGEVKASRAIVETLASSPLLDSGDLKAFHERSVRAMEGRKGAYVILFDASGKQLVNTSRPFGAPLPNPLQSSHPVGFDARYRDVPMGGAANVKRVLETGKPVISDLFIGLLSQEPRIAVDVPVLREGALRYVLQLALDPAELSRLLAEQRSPETSMVAIVDRQGIVVASSVTASSNVGKPLSAELAAQLAGAGSGSGTGLDAQGRDVYHVFTESPLTGWKTSLSVARAAAYAPLSSSLNALLIGVLIAIVVAIVAAVAFGKRVVRLVRRTAQEHS
jgi:hypothetical protein